jgi:GxxExxY protein
MEMMDMMKTYEPDPQTYAIIGAAMEVHTQLGKGFLEAVYQEALSYELGDRGIPHRREVLLPIAYKHRRLRATYRADFIAQGDIVVELKAQSGLTGVDQAQTLNYLKATGHHRALLFNFGATKLQYHRRSL